MKVFGMLSILALVASVLVFLLGVPPFDHVLHHYWTKYHPIARQMKAISVSQGIMVGSAAAAAMDLGVFDLLHAKPGSLTASDIATELDVPLRGIEPVLQVLASADLVYDNKGRYINSATAEHHWISGLSPEKDMGGILRIFGSSTIVHAQSKLRDSIRNGGTVLESHAETDSQPFWEIFAKHTESLSSKTASDMVTKLAHLFPVQKSQMLVLDIATGSGSYGFAVLDKFPQARVIQNDYANVLAITAQNALKRLGPEVLQRRVGQVPGSFFEADLDNDFDVILAPNIVHHFGPQRTVSFLQKVYSHLRPGGHVVIVEMCRPTEPYSVWEGPTPTVRTFSLTMLLWSQQGKAYSSDELIQHLNEAGFEQARLAGTSFPNACFVTAQKSQE